MNHSTHTPLDHPIWSALTTRQTHLRQGDRLACRYLPDVAPFAAISPDPAQSAAAWQALHDLLPPGEHVAMLSLDALEPAGAWQQERLGMIHQMVAPGPVDAAIDDHDVIRLTDADAPEMFDLAQQTKPGPFGTRTHQMGHYIGVRDQGRLIAMAGERMQLDGFVEISAVCVDADYRGKGLAARLMNLLRQQILQRGDTPFLHVISANHGAIALYERLGFERRQSFFLTRLGRAT
jgi:predicted GNAT family acetyltransferase